MGTAVMPTTTTPAAAPESAPIVPTMASVMEKLTAPNPAYQAAPEPVVVLQPPTPDGQPAPAAPEGAAAPVQPQATDLEEVSGDEPAPGDDPNPTPEAPEPPSDQPPPQFEVPDGSTFRVKGADGKYTNLPENVGHIEIEMRTKDGQSKTYVKSLPELVSMARRGIGSEQVIERTRAEAEAVKADAEQALTLNQSFTELMHEVFADESGEAWQRRREEFLQLTSPEARAERAETALQQRDRLDREAKQQHAAQTWYATEVEPAIAQAWKSSPDVSDEAKVGKLNILTNHLLENGVVPPSRRGEFAEIVAGPFNEWVQQEQARFVGFRTATQREQQAAVAAKRAAQDAVNQAGRAMAPVGRAAPDVPVRAKPKNINEALDYVIRGPAGR